MAACAGTRRHSTGSFFSQHGERIFLEGHTEGSRSGLLVHGRVYGQEVLGFRRLWARALVPGLNHFGSVLETVCAFYGAMQWFGERSPDGMLAQVGCSWVPLVEGRTASRCAAVLCAGL